MIELSFRTTQDRTRDLERSLALLKKREVVVGYPENKDVPREDGAPITNAALAYIHDKGSPAANIPARPFMEPGVEDAQEPIERQLSQGAALALDGNLAAVDGGLNGAGLEAQAGIKNKLVKGPFAPLKPRTLKAKVKGYNKRRSDYGDKPLIVTAQLQGAVNYAVRDRRPD